MWVVVVVSASGIVAYVYVYSTQVLGQTALAAAQAAAPPGWSVTLNNTPATDTVFGDTGGEL